MSLLAVRTALRPASLRRLIAGLVIGALSLLWPSSAFADDSPAGKPQLKVEIDFPGGSAHVEQVDCGQRRICLTPSDHAEKGWRCWWYAKVSGLVPKEILTLEVGEAPWATPDRAAVSSDNVNWSQTEPGERQGNRITYRIEAPGEVVYVAWGPPFTPLTGGALVEETARLPFAASFVLTHSKQDREVPALRIHDPCQDDQRTEPPYGVWIQARQHAWESGSSWVCQGLVKWLVSDDPRAQHLRREAVVYVVPIVDIDSVAIGAGGKNQVPHDHNRDWSDQPHWPETSAAMKQIAALDEAGRFDLFVDLHNPGATATEPFYFVAPQSLLTDQGTRNLERFLAASREDMTGPLRFSGRTVESGVNYDSAWKQISKNWVTEHTKGHVVALTLETAWNTPHSNTSGYQTVGAQLGQAIERYFRTDPRNE